MATMEEKIARINELYHKSQTEAGLTPEEKCEQQKLRADYVASRKSRKIKIHCRKLIREFQFGKDRIYEIKKQRFYYGNNGRENRSH